MYEMFRKSFAQLAAYSCSLYVVGYRISGMGESPHLFEVVSSHFMPELASVEVNLLRYILLSEAQNTIF